MLIEAEQKFTEKGIIFWIAGLNPDVLSHIRRPGSMIALGTNACSPMPAPVSSVY
jgi:hypothetical protein